MRACREGGSAGSDRLGGEPMRRVKVKRRRREPGELAGRGHAIRNHCLECMGWESSKAVGECVSPACWLYPWRFGPGGPRNVNSGQKTRE